MAPHEQRNQNLIEPLLLADNYLPHLRENIFAHPLEAFHAISKFGGVKIELRCCGGHRSLSFLGVFDFEEQFLRGAITGSRLQ